MTRGQKGCYIYCTDKNLSNYLKKRLNQNEGIVYPIDKEEHYSDLMVAEDSEEYRYEWKLHGIMIIKIKYIMEIKWERLKKY